MSSGQEQSRQAQLLQFSGGQDLQHLFPEFPADDEATPSIATGSSTTIQENVECEAKIAQQPDDREYHQSHSKSLQKLTFVGASTSALATTRKSEGLSSGNPVPPAATGELEAAIRVDEHSAGLNRDQKPMESVVAPGSDSGDASGLSLSPIQPIHSGHRLTKGWAPIPSTIEEEMPRGLESMQALTHNGTAAPEPAPMLAPDTQKLITGIAPEAANHAAKHAPRRVTPISPVSQQQNQKRKIISDAQASPNPAFVVARPSREPPSFAGDLSSNASLLDEEEEPVDQGGQMEEEHEATTSLEDHGAAFEADPSDAMKALPEGRVQVRWRASSGIGATTAPPQLEYIVPSDGTGDADGSAATAVVDLEEGEGLCKAMLQGVERRLQAQRKPNDEDLRMFRLYQAESRLLAEGAELSSTGLAAVVDGIADNVQDRCVAIMEMLNFATRATAMTKRRITPAWAEEVAGTADEFLTECGRIRSNVHDLQLTRSKLEAAIDQIGAPRANMAKGEIAGTNYDQPRDVKAAAGDEILSALEAIGLMDNAAEFESTLRQIGLSIDDINGLVESELASDEYISLMQPPHQAVAMEE